MKRTQKSCLFRRTKLPLPQHRRKAKRVGTSVATQENASGLRESPENEHKHDTHTSPADDVGCRATPSDPFSTINAARSGSK
ncbi:hypothetical protein MTO96_050076, partial [Rhipicephalus appendiculatus]